MNKQHTLTINFHGISTHFRGVVPGVPHRAVLPNTTMLRTGEVKRGKGGLEPYVILPHLPMVTSPGTVIEVPELIEAGFMVEGVRLQIVNGVGPLTYDDAAYAQLKSLKDYFPAYRPSSEVVYGGRAACYFDFSEGVVTSSRHGEAVHATVSVTTHGKPKLRVTPLEGDPTAEKAPMHDIELEGGELTITNIGLGCGLFDTFDFLLNYITAEGGIPHEVGDIPVTFRDGTAVDFIGLAAQFFTPRGIDRDAVRKLASTDLEGTSPACSDSRYP